MAQWQSQPLPLPLLSLSAQRASPKMGDQPPAVPEFQLRGLASLPSILVTLGAPEGTLKDSWSQLAVDLRPPPCATTRLQAKGEE